MKHYKIRKGHWPLRLNAPVQAITGAKLVSAAAFVGADFPQLRPAFDVAEGDEVALGQALFHDRRNPEIVFVAPFAGTVASTQYGPRRTLAACIVERAPKGLANHGAAHLDDTSDAAVRHTLLGRGMWPALRTRPFGRMPDPNARPAAIFVNATQGTTSAPDPHIVLEGKASAFVKGVAALTMLTDGIVHVCQSKKVPLCQASNRVNLAVFSGTIASGLPGTHIDRLCPVQSGTQVWTVDYQDVAAIGHLFETGHYSADRTVSISGPLVNTPKLVQTTAGGLIKDITATEHAADAPSVVLSGDALRGREATFLGRFHDQISLVAGAEPLANHSWRSRLATKHGALIPKTSLERAIAQRILPVPLMRALSVGDSEAAHRLGCLALVEEDVAILSRLCTSRADYGILLRHVLDELMEDAA